MTVEIVRCGVNGVRLVQLVKENMAATTVIRKAMLTIFHPGNKAETLLCRLLFDLSFPISCVFIFFMIFFSGWIQLILKLFAKMSRSDDPNHYFNRALAVLIHHEFHLKIIAFLTNTLQGQ